MGGAIAAAEPAAIGWQYRRPFAAAAYSTRFLSSLLPVAAL